MACPHPWVKRSPFTMMIISTLEESSRVEALHPAFETLFHYLKTQDLHQLPTGRVELEGDSLFINCMEAPGEPEEERPLEVHHAYIDVHILLEGKERIGWLASKELKKQTQPYSPEKDIAFYADKPSLYIDLLPGQFALLYPGEPHAPLIGNGKIRKLIAKIKLS